MIITGELVTKIKEENDHWDMIMIIGNEKGQIGVQVRRNNAERAEEISVGQVVKLQVKSSFRVHHAKAKKYYHNNIILEEIL